MASQPSSAVAVVKDGRQSSSFLAAILNAATDPNIDATKMETMANLAVKLQDRERETEFNRAKNAAIQDMPVITKEGIITIPAKDGRPARTQGRFARFEDIYRVVRPILQANNLALSFDVAERQAGGVTVRPILSHANGYTERGEAMPLPADASGSKNAAQAVGSSVQYGKRYTMCSMLNIVTEGIDDDGRGGAAPVTLPFEREQLVLEEARAAHEAGKYQEWFGGQSPKDRAWLISSGHHTEFGGQTALPPQRPPQQERTVEPEARKAAPTGTGTREERAAEWTNWFKEEVKGCRSEAAIEGLREEHAVTLASLQKSFPALYKAADTAAENQLASL